jgi:hypothetical protein
MEQITEIANRQLSATQETSERASNTSQIFRAEVGRLIVKIRLVCSLPAFDKTEFAAAIEAFSEVLNGVVPGERLNECYLYAIRHRSSTYPLAVTEIVDAWRVISADEVARRRPCTLCDGSGFGLVYDPKTDTEIQKECPHCFGRVQTAIARA